MIFDLFQKFLVLFFCCSIAVFGQSTDNVANIQFNDVAFPIERPFVITVNIPDSDTRPSITFPDIPGFQKKGTSASVTTSEVNGKTTTTQIITQTYQARAPGRYRLLPFTLLINGTAVRSEGAELLVQPSVVGGPGSATALPTLNIPAPHAAFMSLRASQQSIYAGEGVGLTLSFFVADSYPYVLNFVALEKQLQDITKRIRPVNAWEENLNISELKPIPVLVKGKKYREFRLYEAVFFPLSSRPLAIPTVSLQLTQTRPPTQPGSRTVSESVTFASQPLTVAVRPLPPHPLRGRVPVGTFRLLEEADRQRVDVGQSIRYAFTIQGEGNIAALPAPMVLNAAGEADLFPPDERHTLTRSAAGVTGRKTFTYYVVPRQNGPLPLANRLQWIYFDPASARYDTLRPRIRFAVGGSVPDVASLTDNVAVAPDSVETAGGPSLYAGIETMDSTRQPINVAVLIRAVANVLIIMMLMGMIFVFFKK